MSQNYRRIAILALVLVMPACQNRDRSTTGQSSSASEGQSANPKTTPAVSSPADSWLGKWIGPEGTYLFLSKDGDQFVVKIQSLDGVDTYEGVGTSDGIQFDRSGKTESIHRGSGEETGMKWLLDKKDCLTIKKGEGFCRK